MKRFSVRPFARTLLCVQLVVSILGCGSEPTIQADEEPFGKAITAYLKLNSMGMQVTEFKTLEVTGDTATAKCRLKDAEGLYGLGVTWTFRFQRKADSWEVTSHDG